jgi:hypothetical protein
MPSDLILPLNVILLSQESWKQGTEMLILMNEHFLSAVRAGAVL